MHMVVDAFYEGAIVTFLSRIAFHSCICKLELSAVFLQLWLLTCEYMLTTFPTVHKFEEQMLIEICILCVLMNISSSNISVDNVGVFFT